MEARDTVMKNKKLQLLGQQYEDDCPTCDFTHYALEAQAEITWKARDGEVEAARKAGYKQCEDEGAEGWCDGYSKGERKVVEWIGKNRGAHDELDKESPFLEQIILAKKDWQAQLKKWGIDGH